MDLEIAFNNWLSEALAVEPPAAVVAFSFNLFEPAIRDGSKFAIELIGAATFDPTNSDWACDEVWEPPVRQFLIPLAYSGAHWSECLGRMTTLVEHKLRDPGTVSQQLRSRQAVAVGFVDGELIVIWPPASDASQEALPK